jgi:hypothetical protein
MRFAARLAWDALAPLLPDAGLRALLAAAERDDPALVQGVTTDCDDADPEANVCWLDRPVTGACVVGYPIWKSYRRSPPCAVIEAEFSSATRRAAEALNESADAPDDDRFYGSRLVTALIDAYDTMPRADALALVKELVRRELARRAAVAKGRVADGDVAAGVP